MKRILIIALAFVSLSAYSILRQENTRGLGKVEKVEGKEVYLYSEPLTPYKVVEDYDNSKMVIQTCNLSNLVEAYLKKGKKDKVNFDALYMNTADNIYLIKFIKEKE